jgi:hypothetical protein
MLEVTKARTSGARPNEDLQRRFRADKMNSGSNAALPKDFARIYQSLWAQFQRVTPPTPRS